MRAQPLVRPAGHLLLLACSFRKRKDRGSALQVYDGVNYRVIRKFVLEYGWPPGLIIKILSAKYGLIDATTIIDRYDQRMNPLTALRMRRKVTADLRSLGRFESIFVNLGKDYRTAVQLDDTDWQAAVVPLGGIGKKMQAMKRWLNRLPRETAILRGSRSDKQSYLYFFPDWDDYVHTPFAPEHARSPNPLPRRREYAHEVFGERTPYDGVLVSLAQLTVGKGALSRLSEIDVPPTALRKQMRLPRRLLLFGDCGAFSYASEPRPPFTAIDAAALYAKFGFDAGASVDHIPLQEVESEGETRGKRRLTDYERRQRVALTASNAEEFLRVCNRRKYKFTPIGVIQGLSVRTYVRCVHDYLDMGYTHIALGGLVPRADAEIERICCAVRAALQQRSRGEQQNAWVHLFGILRPKLQSDFRVLGVSSFDSASYLRKAWLRSDQNYLAADGRRWYSSIRVPISTSPAMQAAATAIAMSPSKLKQMEARCLASIANFDGSAARRQAVIDSVNAYGPLLQRKGEDNHFIAKHALLLRNRPWEACRCPFCREIGIEMVVFRGAERNKRRGLHNTWVFYHRVLHGHRVPTQSPGASK